MESGRLTFRDSGKGAERVSQDALAFQAPPDIRLRQAVSFWQRRVLGEEVLEPARVS